MRCLADAVVTTIARNAGRCPEDVTCGGGHNTLRMQGSNKKRSSSDLKTTLRPLLAQQAISLSRFRYPPERHLRGQGLCLPNLPTDNGTVGNASSRATAERLREWSKCNPHNTANLVVCTNIFWFGLLSSDDTYQKQTFPRVRQTTTRPAVPDYNISFHSCR